MTTRKRDDLHGLTRPGDHVPSGPPATTARAGTPARSNADEITAFLGKMRELAPQAGAGQGRLIFGMDATLSRQPAWDLALGLQADMFEAVRDIGGLDVQLVYFRGFRECRASRWVRDPRALSRLMTQITCQGGTTQIGKVLAHARTQSEQKRVNALVFVGDAMEENLDALCARAGELGLLGVPVFMFQEGRDAAVEVAFREIARLSKGAWCPFEAGAAAQLGELLRAVAVYAAGGQTALRRLIETEQAAGARKLLEQLRS